MSAAAVPEWPADPAVGAADVVDAVVIGSGPNGLVAANVLADAGWSVLVAEAAQAFGGGVSSADLTGTGIRSDVCSAFYPLAAASPVLAGMELERYGLRWRHAPAVLAHPLADGRCALLCRSLEETADGLDRLHPGDGAAWRRLYGLWQQLRDPLLGALFTPFPPVRAGLQLGRSVRAAGGLRLARFALLPVRRLLEEEFGGAGGLLIAGSALHADLGPESAGSAMFGWLLAMLGQEVGFPVPEGGAGELAAALVRRLASRGGRVVCGFPVTEVVVRDGRACGVRAADGRAVSARRAVLADVSAPALYGGLVGWEHLPARLRDDLRRFQWDFATVKVDWYLSGPLPWRAAAAGRAGTVHLAPDLDDLTRFAAEIAMGRVPGRPFMLLGQMTTADPSRSPVGTESLWGYTHVPRAVRGDAGDGTITGAWSSGDAERMADRMEQQLDTFAPGFRELIRGRSVLGPEELERHNANLSLGALNAGTAAAHQQLVLRPVPGLGRPETPVRRLYLASASAHPGGGVHGACGANAARAALRADRAGRLLLPLVPLAHRAVMGGGAFRPPRPPV